MFQELGSSWLIVKDSIKVFWRHPKLMVPLLVAWLIFAPSVLYMQYGIDWLELSTTARLGILLAFIFYLALLIGLACSVLLEMIEQLESNRPLNLPRAVFNTFFHNTLKILPIIFAWTVVWFALTLLSALLSGRGREEPGSFNASNAARTLSGYGKYSVVDSFALALHRGLRMVVFLILPAIAWEQMGFWRAVKKGLVVLNAHLLGFGTGFALTGFVALVIFSPVLAIFIADEIGITIANWIWLLVIAYTAFAWSYTLYLEQIFTAELYLWYLKWEQAAARAKKEGKAVPRRHEVPPPSLLDEVPELLAHVPGRITSPYEA